MDTELSQNAAPSLPFKPHCIRCRGLGLWLEPNGSVAPCPEISIGNPHPEPDPAAVIVQRSIGLLRFRKIAINQLDFEIAKSLVNYTSDNPCRRDLLLSKHFTWTPNPLRQFHQHIEELRAVWLLPVGSRKNDPSGYWFITNIDDFAEWFARFKSAPIKQLSTAYHVAKANFPVFAEQMELEFWNDIQPVDQGVAG